MRYFLIFYQGPASGWVLLTDERYPSLHKVKKSLDKSINNSTFFITNIIELSEQDYNDAIKQD